MLIINKIFKLVLFVYNMDVKKKVLLTIVVLLFLVGIFYYVSSTITRLTGFIITGKAIYSEEKLATLANCISEKEIILYSKTTCPYCKKQKKLFKQAFIFLNMIECDIEPEKCPDDILGVPAWEIDGEYVYGVQEIKKLMELSGCGI